MRKKLDTRFPAARIKKIMQADEDVGKIALATPVLISKALEIFLQDLCDRSYEVTKNRGAKTLSVPHIKQCVTKFSEYDFLKDLVSKYGDEAAETGESGATSHRQKKEEDLERHSSILSDARTKGRKKDETRGSSKAPKRMPSDCKNSVKKIKIEKAEPVQQSKEKSILDVARGGECDLDLNLEPPGDQEVKESSDPGRVHGAAVDEKLTMRTDIAAPLKACLSYDSEDNYDD